MSEAVERLVEQLAIPTVLPYQEIHNMVVTGPDQYMGRLSEMSLTNESVWQVVRTAAYGWRDGNRFARLGVIPFIAPCDDKDLSVPANALERLTSELQSLTIGNSVVRVVETQVPYEVFSAIGPAEAYKLTSSLGGENTGRLRLERSGVDTSGWPELRFILFGITRDGGWPLLPEPEKFDASSLANIGPHMTWVGTPDFVDIEALRPGLDKWLKVLKSEFEMFAWEPFPLGGGSTCVLLHGWDGEHKLQFSVNLSAAQLGHDGVAAVLNECASIEQLGISELNPVLH